MKTVGQKLESFNVTGVKPGFNRHEENGESAFAPIDERSFPGKWKVIYFYPKDFTFVCRPETFALANLAKNLKDRVASLFAVSTETKFSRSDCARVTREWK